MKITIAKNHPAFLLKYLLTVIIMNKSSQSFAFTSPKLTDNNHIIDLANKLSEKEESFINEKLSLIEKSNNSKFGIIILNSLNSNSIESITDKVYKDWQFDEVDNSCLLVIDVESRMSEIKTGKIMEKSLTDEKAMEALNSNLHPHLLIGEFFNGITKSISFINNEINLSKKNIITLDTVTVVGEPLNEHRQSTGMALFTFTTFIVSFFILGFLFLKIRQSKKKYNQQKLDLYDFDTPTPVKGANSDEIKILLEKYKRERAITLTSEKDA